MIISISACVLGAFLMLSGFLTSVFCGSTEPNSLNTADRVAFVVMGVGSGLVGFSLVGFISVMIGKYLVQV